MESVTPAHFVPPGLREPPSRRVLHRKKDAEEEGVGFDTPPFLYGLDGGVPFVAFFAALLVAGLILRASRILPELSATLTLVGALFLSAGGVLFGLLSLGDEAEDREQKRLVRHGIVVIGTVTRVETLPIPDDFGGECTVRYTFSPVESQVVIEGITKCVSGRISTLRAGAPVAVIYDPTKPREQFDLLKRLHYSV